MRRVDGYLSRKAQQLWPGSIVYAEEREGSSNPEDELWTLVRPGMEVLDLGPVFHRAQQALTAITAAERQVRSKAEKDSADTKSSTK